MLTTTTGNLGEGRKAGPWTKAEDANLQELMAEWDEDPTTGDPNWEGSRRN